MKILHTSDWHLGRSLFGRKRYDEQEAFLHWLAEYIHTEGVNVLLVAGDVFDTSVPGNRAQELYYRFLCRVADSPGRHVVVTAGNHDSPSFLSAPRELLRYMNVHVVGSITGDPADEVLVLNGVSGTPELVVCAVPYLRDRDIRTAEPGESSDEKNRKLIAGIQEHYASVCAVAGERQEESGGVPIVAMGHLFAAGGKIVEDDGVRELYVGSLARVRSEIFPDCIGYLALGHLHISQKVGGLEHYRYSGSPIPMGFGEANQEKKVMLVEFTKLKPVVKEVPVPCFQALERISGPFDEIQTRIRELKSNESNAWLEVDYTGEELSGNLKDILNDAISDSHLEIRRIKNRRILEKIMHRQDMETLDDLDAGEVFDRCLDAHDVPMEQRPGLIEAHNEILQGLYEEDRNAQ
ncbi:MAG: exonuclease subunit SbcD [Desulfobacteraceae bacterium]|nr:exonuclease subunit SbcD [Desulfobacteraceae bacterium]